MKLFQKKILKVNINCKDWLNSSKRSPAETLFVSAGVINTQHQIINCICKTALIQRHRGEKFALLNKILVWITILSYAMGTKI